MAAHSVLIRCSAPRRSIGLPRRPGLALALILLVAAFVGEGRAANDFSDDRVAPEVKQPSNYGRYLAGRFARYLGDSEAAATFYRQALVEDPNNDVLRGRAFRLLLKAGQIDEALKLARNVRANEREEGLAPTLLVVEQAKRGNLSAAETAADDIPTTGINATLRPVIRAWIKAGQKQGDEAIREIETLNRYPQVKAFQQFHTALIHDLLGNNDLVEATFKDMLAQRAARTSRAVQAYSSFLFRLGRRDEAEQALKDMLADDDGTSVQLARETQTRTGGERLIGNAASGLAEAFYGVARGVLQQQARETAVTYLNMALHLRPDFDVARTVLATIHESELRWDEANQAYAAIKRDSVLGWNARIRMAVNLTRIEKTEEGIAQLRSLGEERTDRTDALVTLGEILRGQQRWDEATGAYDRAIARLTSVTENEWTMFYSRGISLERSKKWERAEADFLKALDLAPEQPLVLNYLGYSWVEQGLNLPKARAMIEKAVDLRPRDGYIIDSLGWVLYRLGDYPEAVRQLERAVALRSDDPVINDHLGDAFWKVGRRSEARFQWERALIFKPEADVQATIERKIKEGLPET
ncbi:MAG: tetratricopeptide repeat protein [Alphaproteobacteria bacterium]|nr:tetratricopeptide repeat protein [Alphaproteobacteria bacterium]